MASIKFIDAWIYLAVYFYTMIWTTLNHIPIGTSYICGATLPLVMQKMYRMYHMCICAHMYVLHEVYALYAIRFVCWYAYRNSYSYSFVYYALSCCEFLPGPLVAQSIGIFSTFLHLLHLHLLSTMRSHSFLNTSYLPRHILYIISMNKKQKTKVKLFIGENKATE